jgi:hypothetical protein
VSKATCLAAIACVVGAALPESAAAQFEFTPFFASYYAVTNVDDDAGGGSKEKQTPAPAVGARFTFWLGSSLGIEAAGSFAFSGTRFIAESPTSGTPSLSLSGTIMSGSGRLLFRPSRTNLHLFIGGGVVTRGGDTWDTNLFPTLTETTDIMGVAGFGVRAAVTPKFALNVSVESHLYSFNPDGDGVAYDSSIQADIYVAIGVPISFGGR